MKLRKRYKALVLVFLFTGLGFFFCLPKKLFKTPTSTVLTCANKVLLSAQIAEDGQWRFPHNDSVPYKFEQCIIHFEDKYFHQHIGLNPLSIFRALHQNIRQKKMVCGGSTLTQQTIRLSRKGKKRSIREKIVEAVLALRLELKYNKKEILALYASNAPFGGNVVGLDAAAWRYYGSSPSKLSWGKVAALAVLPNAPSLIYPGKNTAILLKKRNRLLNKLADNKIIDTETCLLAKAEELPSKPQALPQRSLHLLNRANKDGLKGQLVQTTIDDNLQKRVQEIVQNHHLQLRENGIENAATIVVDITTGAIKSYVGNINSTNPSSNAKVDVIAASRSTGSVLKPILYALMQQEGNILPQTLVPDIPTDIADYAPENFDKQYRGAVKADEALAHSLNIPAVRMLQQYGIEKLRYQLEKLGFSTINQSAEHYGLSLILGGAEMTMWDLANAYAGMARTLSHYYLLNGKYDLADFSSLHYTSKEQKPMLSKQAILDAAGIWHTFNALLKVNRPTQEAGWQQYADLQNIAWKTGTSFGHRDAWAIGITPKHLVCVWVGNADGEGRPKLTGLQSAAPILFDIFSLLPKNKWFIPPYDELIKVPICRESGHRTNKTCANIDSNYIHTMGLKTTACPYHSILHLNYTEIQQVNAQCYDINKMKQKVWFTLPPTQMWYYKKTHPEYQFPPPLAMDCSTNHNENTMQIIYPKFQSQIFIPKNFDSSKSKSVFEVAHSRDNAILYWHLNDTYLGFTEGFHQIEIAPDKGKHLLSVVDNKGETLYRWFEVI